MQVNDKFQEMGNYLIQMGLYLCTKETNDFEIESQLHTNIINFLMQSYLFLKSCNDKQHLELKENNETTPKANEESYLSRKEVLEMYHPLLTEYGLSQSIHTKGFPYIKRGSKYFFRKSEIDDWLKDNKGNCGSATIKFV